MKKTLSAILATLIVAGCSDSGQQKTAATGAAAPSIPSVKLGAAPAWVPAGDIAPGGECNIDAVNDKHGLNNNVHSVSRKSPGINTWGWAALSTKDGIAASEIALTLKNAAGVRRFAPVTRYARPDVADYFKNPGIAESGFKALVSVADVEPGGYQMEVVMAKDGKIAACKWAAQITIVD